MHPLEAYLKAMLRIHAIGQGVGETSFYPAIERLFNEVGKELKPKVHCLLQLANAGAGHPDAGLFSHDQIQSVDKHDPLGSQAPSRGVVEIKGLDAGNAVTVTSKQVAGYWKQYRKVLVTNYREFILVGEDLDGHQAPLETFTLAKSEDAFWDLAAHPRKAAKERGDDFVDYLKRVILIGASITDPADLAWLLAMYARQGLRRIAGSDLPALATVRKALEEALGMKFAGDKGEHFFESTLVQTLFYGVFSAWVLWARSQRLHVAQPPSAVDSDSSPVNSSHVAQPPPAVNSDSSLADSSHVAQPPSAVNSDSFPEEPQPGAAVPHRTQEAKFDWHHTGEYLRVPILQALYHQAASPGQLKDLGLDEILHWATAVLNRVDRAAFFAAFREEHAVQYFYEPFLEAYDPALRKELGVWYTPEEIVKYQVARVDTVLREELDIPDGLADPNVYVLDPCCGTGAYLVEVLRKIHETLRAQGGDALMAQKLKQAAMERVFGFEILPAPFVISHLQLGLLLGDLGAPLANHAERVAVYLTNALTGWEPPKEPKQRLLFAELQAERDAAEKVKQQTPILVILGNPPYNGFADVAVDEERDLTNAYRTTTRAPKPQGQGLNDLYVRFFRVAERKIVEGTGKGIVCFISNYSWLDGLSHTGMRERYLDTFDTIWIDNLHGDRMMSEYAPDGRTSQTVFSISGSSVGIKIGTSIALLVQGANPGDHNGAVLWYADWEHAVAEERRRALLHSAQHPEHEQQYSELSPQPKLGLPFKPRLSAAAYVSWPRISDLLPMFSPGVKTSRDAALVDIDREILVSRIMHYFDPSTDDHDMRSLAPCLMDKKQRFDPKATRAHLLARGIHNANFVRYAYRPFDLRWVYWEPETKLLDEKRAGLFSWFRSGTRFMTSRQKGERQNEGTPFFITGCLPDVALTRPHSTCYPLRRPTDCVQPELDFNASLGRADLRETNVSEEVGVFLNMLSMPDQSRREPTTALWLHILATGYSPTYLQENAGALWQDYPHIPLPSSKALLESSAALGEQVAALLDTESGVKGVTTGKRRPEMPCLGVVSRVGRGSLDPNAGDLDLTVGWGHGGKGGVTMPGTGRVEARAYTSAERDAIAQGADALGLPLDQALACLGDDTRDIYLNGVAFWRNVPARVWDYTIGGYQVIKKWLSYRESKLLGRGLTTDEAQYVTEMVRRLAALRLLEPALDANYEAVKANTYPWPAGQ